MSEASLSRRVQQRIRELGGWVVKYHSSQYTRRGIPDLLVCFQGKFFAMELKLPGKEPDEHQIFEMEAIEAAGGAVATVRSVEDAELLIEQVISGPAA